MIENKIDYPTLRRWIDELEKIDIKIQIEGYNEELFNNAMNLQEKIRFFFSDKLSIILDKKYSEKVNKVINREYYVNKLERSRIIDIIKDFYDVELPEESLIEIGPYYIPHDDAHEIIKGFSEGKDWFENETEYYLNEYGEENHLVILHERLFDLTRNMLERRNSLGIIFTSRQLSEIYEDHLQEIKNCFSLGLYKSSMVFCRTVLEYALFDLLRKRGEIKRDDYDISSFNKNLERSKKYIGGNLYDKIDKVRRAVNDLLHKKDIITIRAGTAYYCIRETFIILEKIL